MRSYNNGWGTRLLREPKAAHQEPLIIDRSNELTRITCESAHGIVLEFGGVHSKMIWDYDVRPPKKRNGDVVASFPGCYIIIENLHRANVPIYVGQSGNILQRLYQHFGSKGSPVYSYDRVNQKFDPCLVYGITCDCLPRYFAEVFRIEGDLDDAERTLIARLNPVLNQKGKVKDSDLFPPAES